MSIAKNVRPADVLLGRVGHGTDLLEALTTICREHGTQLGKVEGIGAVQKARLGFYDQAAHAYHLIELGVPMEILFLMGPISAKDEAPFIHAHVTLSNAAGRPVGGHLVPGTAVFACGFIIESL